MTLAQTLHHVVLHPSRRMGKVAIAAGVAVMLGAVCYAECGIYTVPPIDVAPDGSTEIVWRGSGEPTFNSPDATCLQRMGGVSTLCRAMVMGQASTDRVILRLPYQAWAYHLSTNGEDFGD